MPPAPDYPAAASAARPAHAQGEYAIYVETLLSAMRRTQPWITMFSVLSFIGGVFMGLAGVMYVTVGAVGRGPLGAIGPLMSLVYFAGAGIYFVSGRLLWSYRGGIVTFVASGGEPGALSMAIDRQASFWRFMGILTIVMMVLYAVLFVGVFAFMAASYR